MCKQNTRKLQQQMIEEFITTFFQEIIWNGIVKLGALLRWIFLKNQYSFKEILQQNWNGRIGLLFIASVVVLIIWVK